MNQGLHRVIFNAARGLRMVVAETASGAGKGNSTGNITGIGSAGSDGWRAAAFGIGWTALAAMSLLGYAAGAHAQIVPNPFAAASQKPQVLVAPNGVPLVNITTPSAAGVSINQYNQFDVTAAGAILNNSRTTASTQLGGLVQGNPWLATGPARIIVNQVTSSNPSYLNGYIEVAGQRAEVIIANPSGISVSNGGFINTSRATLTTGTPQYGAMGTLDSFLVQGGTITVNGNGLDLSTTDYAAILSRALQVLYTGRTPVRWVDAFLLYRAAEVAREANAPAFKIVEGTVDTSVLAGEDVYGDRALDLDGAVAVSAVPRPRRPQGDVVVGQETSSSGMQRTAGAMPVFRMPPPPLPKYQPPVYIYTPGYAPVPLPDRTILIELRPDLHGMDDMSFVTADVLDRLGPRIKRAAREQAAPKPAPATAL